MAARESIAENTIICEYSGEVCSKKDIKIGNDSIFTLIITHFAKTSLDIAPSQFGNISRFISGISRKQL